MTSIQLNKELPEEFFSDVLITAFDGAYGAAWEWFEPVDNNWLAVKKVHDTGSCTDDIWVSAKVRLQEDYETGHPLFDSREGFVIDHASIAGGISRIVNDDYLDVWRPATPSEEDAIDQEAFNREWRGVATEHGTGYEVHTGETARGLRSMITRAVQDVEAGDIDAGCADAIVQAAAFGKVIFG
jgi:hypothetical protein